MVTPLLQAPETAHGSFKASPTSKNDGWRRRLLLVLGVGFNSQETHRNLDLKLMLGFQIFRRKIDAIGASFYKGFMLIS
jgi:hypothetical protein